MRSPDAFSHTTEGYDMQLQAAFADPAAGVALDTVGNLVLKPYRYSSSEG